MNPWPFITWAYLLTIVPAGAITAWAWIAMRRAEGAVEDRDAR